MSETKRVEHLENSDHIKMFVMHIKICLKKIHGLEVLYD